ncbi:hypothetical protein L3D22_01140 [Lysobacter soli]|uniref:hypothetical protein n=1 Tax=Lysobacter soli TaxID=453783 RepID=UPI00209FCBB4|nr:hypothetical protein [Lysobacter soli]UTA54505.1 hypothetical protein L3D22_01140 [Lysobacter soli]
MIDCQEKLNRWLLRAKRDGIGGLKTSAHTHDVGQTYLGEEFDRTPGNAYDSGELRLVTGAELHQLAVTAARYLQ